MASVGLVRIAVEHPQYTRRFDVYVPASASVRDVKNQIACVCPGNPDSAGQRLICKGRVLNDSESIDSIWVVCYICI